MGFAVVGFNTVEQVKRAVTIETVLKSAQPNKPGLAEDYYIQELAPRGARAGGRLLAPALMRAPT